MPHQADPRVDAYISALPEWQQEICRRVRDLVHAADPEVVETIKRTRQPYFVLEGNICALLAAKPSFPTRTASSPPGMTTRQRAPSPIARATRSRLPL